MKRFSVFALTTLLVADVWGSVWAQTPEELLAVEAASHVALNAQDLEQVVSYFTDDGVYDYAVAGVNPVQGKEGIKGFFAALLQAFPDFHVEQRRRLASSNIVVTECTVTGTHQGEWMGIPATGNTIQTIHMDVYEFEGDKIKKVTTYDAARSDCAI